MTSKWLAALLATGCVAPIDDDVLDTDESELIYCSDVDDDCEPPPAPSARPDLVASPLATQCRFVPRPYPRPHKEIGFMITNNGAAASTLHTARVQFTSAYMDYVSTPIYLQLPALEPGASAVRYVTPYTLCWSSGVGCTIKVTADYANANTESNESNNTVKWYCNKEAADAAF